MIRLGMERGIRWFDFGINAKRDEAQIHFKEGFRAYPFPIEHFIMLNSIKAFLGMYYKKFRFLIKLVFKI
jgi:lipid II:glycine glycyltransferase (peptidoglycan interpeptide bridge formation enzyme)